MRSDGSWWWVAAGGWRHAALGAACAATLSAQPTLSVEGRSSANPSSASSGRFVALTWSAADAKGMDVYAALSGDGGSTFSAPVRVNATPYDARVGGEQPPRVALIPGAGGPPELVVVWTSKGPAGTRLLTARSKDGAKTFGPSTVVPGSDAAGNRGWESLAVGPKGRVFALWLDHRETAAAPMPAMHQHGGDSAAKAAASKPDPVERAGLSKLWFGSLDGAVKSTGVAAGVCYCCKTSLTTAGNEVYAVWRHVFPGNQRDIAFAASRDGGRTFSPPVRVSEDGWKFDGCPENGPAIAVGTGGRLHVAWVTPLDGKEGAPLALYTASSPDGKAFTPRSRIATDGAAGHVQLATLGDGSLLLAWDEVAKGGRRIHAARGTVAANGSVAFKSIPLPGAEDGTYPVVTATAGGAITAWVRRAGGTTTIAVAAVK